MGISVISNIAANSGLAASAAAPAATDALHGDFAALLSSQTLATTMTSLIGGLAEAKGKTENAWSLPNSTDGLGNEGLPLDPSILAAMIGMPPLPLAATQGQNSGNPASEERGSSISGDILSALAGRTAPAPEEPNIQSMAKGIPDIASTRPVLDAEHQLAGLTSEAANIAADSPANSGSASNFDTALSNATLQQEKVAAKQSMVSTPLTSEAWPKQFGEKIVWLARNDQQTAQININPPQLGPIQITLNLNGDQASAIFASPHAEVRQAIEAAMPQLKEMLSSAGISLGDANVSANLAQQSPDNPFLAANKNQSGHENAILPANENAASTGVSQVLQRGRGLVDLFA